MSQLWFGEKSWRLSFRYLKDTNQTCLWLKNYRGLLWYGIFVVFLWFPSLLLNRWIAVLWQFSNYFTMPLTSTLHFNIALQLFKLFDDYRTRTESEPTVWPSTRRRLVVNLASVEFLNSLGCETFCKPCKIKCEQTCQKYRSETLFFIIYFSGFLYTKCIKIS